MIINDKEYKIKGAVFSVMYINICLNLNTKIPGSYSWCIILYKADSTDSHLSKSVFSTS